MWWAWLVFYLAYAIGGSAFAVREYVSGLRNRAARQQRSRAQRGRNTRMPRVCPPKRLLLPLAVRTCGVSHSRRSRTLGGSVERESLDGNHVRGWLDRTIISFNPTRILTNRSACTIVLFLADRRQPGALVDTSWTRLDSGRLTKAEIARSIERSRAKSVVAANTFTVVPGLLRSLQSRFPVVLHRDFVNEGLNIPIYLPQ
jgi:hypothetical protein